jgi:hypothetical protein
MEMRLKAMIEAADTERPVLDDFLCLALQRAEGALRPHRPRSGRVEELRAPITAAKKAARAAAFV